MAREHFFLVREIYFICDNFIFNEYSLELFIVLFVCLDDKFGTQFISKFGTVKAEGV